MLDALGDARAWLFFCIIKKKGWDQCSCMLYAAWLADRCCPKRYGSTSTSSKRIWISLVSLFRSIFCSLLLLFLRIHFFLFLLSTLPHILCPHSYGWRRFRRQLRHWHICLPGWVLQSVVTIERYWVADIHNDSLLFFKAASFLDALGLNLLKLDHVKEAQKPASQRRRDCYRPLWHLGLSTYIASQVIGSTIALS